MGRIFWSAGRRRHFIIIFVTLSEVDGATKKILVRKIGAEYGIFFSEYWKFFHGVHRSGSGDEAKGDSCRQLPNKREQCAHRKCYPSQREEK